MSKRILPQFDSVALLESGSLIYTEDVTRQFIRQKHWHDSYEIGIVIKGHAILQIKQQTHLLNTEQIYIISTTDEHQLEVRGDGRVFVVHFHPAILQGNWHRNLPFSSLYFPEPLFPRHSTISDQVVQLLLKLRHETTLKYPAWENIAVGILVEIAGYLARYCLSENPTLRQKHQKQQQALKRIQPALKLIEEHYMDNLSLKDIAAAAFVSPSHCCVLFQTALNSTPIHYRNNRRIVEACRLLRETDYSMREIAFMVGMGSVQTFNRVFQSERRMTPTQYRQQRLKQRA